ncbi:MobV family relaxase [Carnobacterium jeotgali]|uniref:MobV family relaxase n=1 Tax=Carnobacterium jeotgali TaxID=545534 RepID=UPI00388E0B46
MAQGFEVFRMEKLKTEGAVVRSLRHDLDLSYENEQGEKEWYRKTRNDELSKQNQYWGKVRAEDTVTQDELYQRAMKRWRSALPEKRRKNAVVGAQAIFSFSHELLQDKNFKFGKYLSDCLEFCRKEFGKDNVVNWALHMDEKTPHITVLFVPKDEKGNLNARKIFGNKKTLSEWQDKFHAEVGEKYNLKRGIKKTNIIHQTLDRFYGQLKNLDEDLDKLELSKKSLGESWEDYFTRTKAELKSFVEPMLKPLATLRTQVAKFEKERENHDVEYSKRLSELAAERSKLDLDQKNNDKYIAEQVQKGKKELSDKLRSEIYEELNAQFMASHERYNEVVEFLDAEPYKFSRKTADGEKSISFASMTKQELAKELASWYLDDEPTVHKRKREIEREFERNRVNTRTY